METALDSKSSSLLLCDLPDYGCQNSSTSAQSEMRNFILYRYYQSQYPDLFDELQKHTNNSKKEKLSFGIQTKDQVPIKTITNGKTKNSKILILNKDALNKQPKQFSSQQQQQQQQAKTKNKCCVLCSKSPKSDSSLWSLSENDDINTQIEANKTIQIETIWPEDIDKFDKSNYHVLTPLLIEKDAHLARVITPPDAFQCEEKKISYENKITQTDPEQTFDRNTENQSNIANFKQQHRQQHQKIFSNYQQQQSSPTSSSQPSQPPPLPPPPIRLSRFNSLGNEYSYLHSYSPEVSKNSSESLRTVTFSQPAVEPLSENIYQTLVENRKLACKMGYKSKNFNPTNIASSIPETFYSFDSGIEQLNNSNEINHHFPMSKNGIPCVCERCRECRGLNLTTELLPLDTAMPLQSMDNLDSLFQDSSVAELICRIL